MRMWRVLAAVGALVMATPVVAPAWACGCGGYMPDAASTADRARVDGERALVRFDGTREEIVLSMAVRGSSRKAAWVMPVPSQATVELADEDLFSQLERAIRPRVERRTTYWPDLDWLRRGDGAGDSAGAPPGSGVDVRARMRLGPFEVARLGGSSGVAVESWLGANGYVVPAGLAANIQPYAAQRWEFVAVKLAPESESGRMSGATPPLRLSFAATELVYPMRMSKGATTAQTVTLYVAAPYKVQPTTLPDPAVEPELLYAGRYRRSGPGDPVAQLQGTTPYLTAYTVRYDEPGRIAADFHFAKAANDDEFQRVRVITENEGAPATIGLVLVVVALVGAGAAVVARRIGPRPPQPGS